MSDGYHRLLDMTTLTSPDLLALPIKLPGGRLSGKTKFLGLSYFTGDHRDYVNTSFKIGLPGRSGFQAIPRHMLYPKKQYSTPFQPPFIAGRKDGVVIAYHPAVSKRHNITQRNVWYAYNFTTRSVRENVPLLTCTR